MDRIRGYKNWYIVIWSMLFISVFVIFGCGTDDEKTDPILTNTDTLNDTSPTAESTPVQENTIEQVELKTQKFTIDATSAEEWTYFSFQSGDVVEIGDALTSEEWDLGFQRTRVKINGGISGPGMGSAIMLTDTTFEEITVASANGYISDSEATLAIVAQSEKGWYIYTGPPTHWVLPLEDRVFVIKAADGTYAKLRFLGYYKDNDKKVDSGYVTFEYVHQRDGSRNF